MSRMTVRYVGSGPYCYANSLAMMLGSAAHGAAVIKVLPNSSKPAWNLAARPPTAASAGADV